MPKTARTTSLRPEPTSPANATISPVRTVKETSSKRPVRVRFETSSTVAPTSAGTLGNSSASARPTIRRTTSAGDESATSASATVAPSRMTVNRSQSANTSSRRWLTKTTAAPRSRSRRATSIRRPASTADSAAVGSSITITRASIESAFAISTICWSAIDRPAAVRSGSRCTPSRSNSSAARWFIVCQSTRPPVRGWRPTNTFSASDRSGKRLGSW